MKKLKIGILDQSVVRTNSTAAQAIDETIETVQLAERLGYSRFWVSEHHNSTFIAGSAPELLIVKLAGVTSSIRVGSGGVMLPNHSALKVAENFRMLETLYPNRIDLGMGRAPGTDRLTSSLLNPSNDFSEKSYLRQLEHLQHFFEDSAGTDRGFIYAVPQSVTTPQQWILCSSGGSAGIAAQFGMGLAVAKFINGFADSRITDVYRRNFVPSPYLEEPKVLVSTFVLCADTEEKAAEMRKIQDFILLQFERGNFGPFPPYEDIKKYRFSPGELERIQYNSGRLVSGTKDAVKEQLEAIAREFSADELMISTMGETAEIRKRSFELVAEAMI